MVGVIAHLRRQVEGDREARLPLLEEIAVAPVRLRRRAEAGVLAHGPEPAAVHRGLDAARVRELARESDAVEVVLGPRLLGSVDALERGAVGSCEEPRPVGRLLERGPERARFPVALRVVEPFLLFGRHSGQAFIAAERSQRPRVHSGMFPCLRGGFESRFVCRTSSAWINRRRVSLGSMTSSI